MRHAFFSLCSAAVMAIAMTAISVSAVGAAETERTYIVWLEDSVRNPGTVAHAQVDVHEGDMTGFYTHALKGYAAKMPAGEVDELRRDSRVVSVTPNRQLEFFAQTTPTGVERSFASTNKALSIDAVDNVRADVDVAVLDSGIDYTHPDLNVVARTNCFSGTCIDNAGTDEYGHGTHVAGTIGAIDNGVGVTGVAPGARLWAVKMGDAKGNASMAGALAGIDWITARADQIEVVNMSFGGKGNVLVVEEAINRSINAGVVYVAAAGNSFEDAKETFPANIPGVITVSGLADYDGKPGGLGGSSCEPHGADDHSYDSSNYGSTIEIAAPAVCILSTWPGGEYKMGYGTSMAAPHVSGAAAIVALASNPNSKADVEKIRTTLVNAGNLNWTDDSPDGIKERLLDLSNETTFRLKVPAPVNTGAPVVSPSTPLQGVPETTTNGTWNVNPYTFTYQWQRCLAACLDIAGATKQSYTPVAGDVGYALRVKVTAGNSGGTTSVFSNQSPGKAQPLGQINEYPLPSGFVPSGLTAGPDGNVWFTATKSGGGPTEIGKLTTAGAFTEYPLTEGWEANGIAKGPDGNLWITSSPKKAVAKVTTAGAATYYSMPGNVQASWPNTIAAGPDGNVWVAGGSSGVYKVTPTGTTTTYNVGGTVPAVSSGPDGNMWFANWSANKIGKIYVATGSVVSVATASAPNGIAGGPDGRMWFALGSAGKLGAAGTNPCCVTEFALPSTEGWPMQVVAGPDGNVWYNVVYTDIIGRIAPFTGVVTEYKLPKGSYPWHLTVGPDSRIWFTMQGTKKIGSIVP